MRNSFMFIAIAASLAGTACAGSSVRSETTRVSRVSVGGLGGLWISSPAVASEGEIRVASREEEPTSDLWIKKAPELDPAAFPEKQTPRLDYALQRLTPGSTATFVEVSKQNRARQ